MITGCKLCPAVVLSHQEGLNNEKERRFLCYFKQKIQTFLNIFFKLLYLVTVLKTGKGIHKADGYIICLLPYLLSKTINT